MQTCICKAIDDTSLQGIYKLSHSWVIVWTTVQTNNTKCVSKGILIQASGLKVVKTCTFQCSPHMMDSTSIYNPPILWCSRLLEGRFTILKEDPATKLNSKRLTVKTQLYFIIYVYSGWW
jgi:hypothetical protein